MRYETDVAVIGGGLVGISVGYGLALQGVDSLVLDEGDGGIRASRGNFGLVWVQGKGLRLPAYTDWAMRAIEPWGDFARVLASETGIEVGLSQKGGLFLCQSEEALFERSRDLATIRANYGRPYHYEILDNAALREMLPQIGRNVVGGSYSSYDGLADPLRLLHALHRVYLQRGGHYRPDAAVIDIAYKNGKYVLRTANDEFVAERIVLAAGLGNKKVGEMLGVEIPLTPIRGQVLVTERVPPLFDIAIEQVRQTPDGTLLIGGSWEDVGFDLNTSFDVSHNIARGALHLFPFLKNVRVIRSWSALRIIAPDAAPIYDEIAPGAFLVTCHSGVSLAAIHAYETAKWIADGCIPAEMSAFGLERFSEARS